MQDEQYLEALAATKAVEMIVRGLFTKWAEEAPDPRASAQRMINAMIASVDDTTKDGSPFEAELLQRLKDNLRHFGEQIETRLTGLGHTS